MNILLTNVCNGRCPYCFASIFLKEKAGKKQDLSVENFEKILDFIKKSSPKSGIKLLGGEPTLHSKLDKILSLTVEKGFKKIYLFSNGILSPNSITIIKKYLKYLTFVWNVNPPDVYPIKLNSFIEDTISKLPGKSVVLGFNIFRLDYDLNYFYQLLNKIPFIEELRIGLAHPVGDKQYSKYSKFITVNQYEEIGSLIYRFILKIKNKYPQIKKITLDCGYVPCLFTKKQLKEIYETKLVKPFNLCGLINDIDVDLGVRACFATSNDEEITKLKNYSDTRQMSSYRAEQTIFNNRFLPLASKKCLQCKMIIQCNGGCRGERMLVALQTIDKYKEMLKKETNTAKKITINYKLAALYCASNLYKESLRLLGQITKDREIVTDFELKKSCEPNLIRDIYFLKKHLKSRLNLNKIISNKTKTLKEKKLMNKLERYKQLYMTYPNNKTRENYASIINKLVTINKNGRQFLRIEAEVKQFVDSLWNSRYLLDDPFIIFIYAQCLKKIYGNDELNEFYKRIIKINPFLLKKIIA